jgi:hypothetical protein
MDAHGEREEAAAMAASEVAAAERRRVLVHEVMASGAEPGEISTVS